MIEHHAGKRFSTPTRHQQFAGGRYRWRQTAESAGGPVEGTVKRYRAAGETGKGGGGTLQRQGAVDDGRGAGRGGQDVVLQLQGVIHEQPIDTGRGVEGDDVAPTEGDQHIVGHAWDRIGGPVVGIFPG